MARGLSEDGRGITSCGTRRAVMPNDRAKREDSQAASNIDERDENHDETFWEDLDHAGATLKQTLLDQSGVGLVNYNLEDLPAPELRTYAAHTTQLVRI